MMRGLIVRAFANAVVRRLGYALVAIIFASLGFGHARAAGLDQGEAYSSCMSYANAMIAANPDLRRNPQCPQVQPFSYQCQYEALRWIGDTQWGRDTCGDYSYGDNQLCNARPKTISTFNPKSASVSCSEGCTQHWFRNDDGTSTGIYGSGVCSTTDFKDSCGAGFYWNQTLNVCEPVKEECEGGKKLNSNGQCAEEPCPEGMIQQQDGTCKAKENECPAGEVKSPDGSCIKKPDACGAGQAQGKDGTCKPDKDGDGTPDDEDSDDDGEDDKKSFSGGDDCNSPPSCSGDPIMCGQARIQWRIDCNTRRNVNIAGGSCNAVPVCTGQSCNAIEYSQLLMQWRTACAVENLKNGTDGGQKGDANGNGVADVLEGTGTVTGPGDGDADVASAKRFGIGISTDLINKENIFGGGACPQPPTFKFYGTTISGADFPYFCQAAAILRALILIWGAYTALKILMNGGF